jgi:hypothetical protein
VPRALAILLLVGAVLVVPSGGGGLITVVLLAPMSLSITALGAILARRTTGREQALSTGPAVRV